jgi:hypothetical protein
MGTAGWLAENPGSSGGRPNESKQHPHGRRLSRPIEPKKAVDLATDNAQSEIVHGQTLAVSLRETTGLDDDIGLQERSLLRMV